jgi:hypothetical protein
MMGACQGCMHAQQSNRAAAAAAAADVAADVAFN